MCVVIVPSAAQYVCLLASYCTVSGTICVSTGELLYRQRHNMCVDWRVIVPSAAQYVCRLASYSYNDIAKYLTQLNPHLGMYFCPLELLKGCELVTHRRRTHI